MPRNRKTRLPAEVWVLVNSNGSLVPSLDHDGTEVFMAWPSKEDAEIGQKHQWEMYGQSGGFAEKAVRLFPQ